MDHFFLKLSPSKSVLTLAHGDTIGLIGSCFSDEIAKKLKNAGHLVQSNPWGTLFHPTAMAYQLLDCFNSDLDQRIFERNGLYYSWNTSTLIHGTTKESVQQQLLALKQAFHSFIKNSKILIVTFGSAWGYELKEDQQLVANCHKMPAQLFDKFLSSPYELVQDWVLVLEKLQELNPSINVIFTVSPMRHIKDGIVENNLSKARLIEAVHQLSYEPNCAYFPSYELVIDVLRDYRFFKEDRVHPSAEAINFVWNHFEETFFDDTTIALNRSVEKVNQMKLHKATQNIEQHLALIKNKEAELSQTNANIVWME